MGLAALKPQMSIEEYFILEEHSGVRHEFHDGEALAMSGGTYEHSLIITNLIRQVGNRLDGTPCRVLEGNMRVRVGRQKVYVYPDATIVCGEPQFDPLDRKRTTVTNPRVIFEVLSESTEPYDRGEKFALYQSIPTSEAYVLLGQDAPIIEVWSRQGEVWTPAVSKGLGSVATILSPAMELPLQAIYDGISFPSE